MQDKIIQKIMKIKRHKEKEGKLFGMMIKEERMRFGFTQESFSGSGLGYQSKVEHAVICPSDAFIKDVSDMMNLDFSKVSPSKKNKYFYFPLIRAYVLSDLNALEDFYTYANQFANPTLKIIIEFAMALVNNNDSFKLEPIQFITKHLETLDDYLRQFSICLVANYYYKTHHYKETISLLKAFETATDERHKDIIGLTHHYLYLAYQALDLKSNASMHYNSAILFYQSKKVFDRVTELELIHLENLYHESTLHMDVMLDELSINETTSFNHIHHFQYLDIMSQIEAIEKLDILSSRVITCLNEKNHTYYRYKLLIECYHRLPFNQQEKAKIHDIITRMPDKKAYKLLKHQFKSYHLKQSELKIFLKEEALPDAITMNQLYYIKYFTDQLIDISIDNHRYKEGLYHQKKFKRILKKLQSFY